jgi:NAD-dependent deacetylase
LKKQKLVALTGAGVSVESGLQTFRDSDGLWEGYDVREVATFDAWQRNPVLVQDFYNKRRKAVLDAVPNEAHLLLASLEDRFDVTVITQNIDDLHERAGSTDVLHLHGQIGKSRSTKDPNLVYEIKGWELKMGDTCELGSQLRPHIVWFGESVPEMPRAAAIASRADIFMVVGTSLVVYPAAGLVSYVKPHTPVYVIDPGHPDMSLLSDAVVIREKATRGMKRLVDEYLER